MEYVAELMDSVSISYTEERYNQLETINVKSPNKEGEEVKCKVLALTYNGKNYYIIYPESGFVQMNNKWYTSVPDIKSTSIPSVPLSNTVNIKPE